jgi:hypothetical protein
MARPGRYWMVLLGAVVILICGMCGYGIYAVIKMERANACELRLKAICQGLQMYEATYRCLPPSYVLDNAGERKHSWRALLLPYFYYGDTDYKYDYVQRWNAARNEKCVGKYNVYQCPSHSDSSEMTNYVAVVDKASLWPLQQAGKLQPGSKNKILLVELARSDIPWRQPKDIELGEFVKSIRSGSASVFYNEYVGGVLAIDASGECQIIDPSEPEESIRKRFLVEEEK